jgi:DNA polymerase III delta prime subunit
MKKAEITPKTGNLHEDYSEAKTQEVAAKCEEFDAIFIDTPFHLKLMSQLDCLRLKGRLNTTKPHRALRCLAPPSTGKTTVAQRYAQRINDQFDAEKEHIPVLYISLQNSTTSRRLKVAMLEALNDFAPTQGAEDLLKRRLVNALRKFKVEVIIIDEVHHLAPKRNTGEVINVLKAFLNERICPLAFIGTDDALKLFTTNKELGQRISTIADIKPLPNDKSGQGILQRFLKEVDREIRKAGLFQEPSDFLTDEAVSALMRITRGVMGLSTRLLGAALEISVRRNASYIELYDVSRAVDAWAIPNGFCKTNPFRSA